jgi:hypothetical protein
MVSSIVAFVILLCCLKMDRSLSASDFKCSCSLLCCPDCCEETPDHNIAPHVEFDWAATLRCDACDSRTEWHLCCICETITSRCKDRRELGKHQKQKCHSVNIEATRDNDNSGDSNVQMAPEASLVDAGVNNNNRDDGSSIPMGSVHQFLDCLGENGEDPSSFTDLFKGSANVQYFEREHHNPCNGGLASLTALAIHGDRNRACDIDRDTSLWTLLMTWFCSRLTTIEKEVFSAIQTHALLDARLTTPQLKVPSSVNELNNMFVKGKFSIPENLPLQMINELPDGHIYLPVLDSIRDLCAHGRPVEPIIPKTTETGNPTDLSDESYSASHLPCHSRTPRGKELLNAAKQACGEYPNVFICGLYPWSDGFDPNTVVQNLGSVWALFISIATPEGDIHSGCNTYLVALGPASADHGLVKEMLAQELKQLCAAEGFSVYYGPAQKNIRMFAQVYSVQQDSPESTTFTQVAAGNSNMTARRGHCGDLPAVQDFVASCDSCYKLLLSGEIPSSCSQCANWDFNGLTYPTPKDYPADEDGTKPSHLPFVEISFASMRSAAEETHEMVLCSQWKSVEGKAYLRTNGLQPDLQDLVVRQAENAKELDNAKRSNNQRLLNGLEARRLLNPDSFKSAALPSIWQLPGVELRDFINVIMHLLFLGVVRTTVKESLVQWLKAHDMFSSFVRQCKAPMDAVKALNIVWVKAPRLGVKGTFPGALSENWLATSRLSKWLFGGISMLEKTDEKYVDPDIPHNKYTGKHIKAWLKARRISPEGKYVRDIRRQFEQLLLQPSGPPEIPDEEGAEAPLDLVEDIVISLVAMVSRLMVEGTIREEEAVDADRHIKIFLTCVEHFDRPVRDSAKAKAASASAAAAAPEATAAATPKGKIKKASWLSHYNFVNLLNLPDTLRRYGSLRLLWEGDGKGEGALRLLKPLIRGLKGKWAYNAALSYLKLRSIQRIMLSSGQLGDKGELSSSFKAMLEALAHACGSSNAPREIESDRDIEAYSMPTCSGRKRPRHDNESATQSHSGVRHYVVIDTFLDMGSSNYALTSCFTIAGHFV